MKIVLALALVLAIASIGRAQGFQGPSDDYVCNHGLQGDPATTDACGRLRGAESDSDAAVAPTEEVFAPSPAKAIGATLPSAAFRQGQDDRARYEAWRHSLSGDFMVGAAWWEAHRSDRRPAPCAGPASPSSSPGWTQGCLTGQRALAGPDRQRHASSDYRQGWNHPQLASAPAATPAVAPASAAPTPAPAATAAAPPTPVPTDVGEAPIQAAPPVNQANSSPAAVDHPAGGWPGLLGSAIVAAIFFACICGLAIYFIPTLIAMARRKRNAAAIFALNLFLGWSFIGWVAALIWSLAVDSPPAHQPLS